MSYSYNGTNGLLSQALLTSVFEFVCAQSPYNMRGLIVSFVGPLLILTETVCSIISLLFLSREMWKIMVLSYFVFNKIYSMPDWISLVLCCSSLVQDKSERC